MSDIIRKRSLPFSQRLPVIIKGLWDGKNNDKIALECHCNEKTIRRDRKTIQFQELFDIFMGQYLQELAQAQKMGDKGMKRLVLLEKGRFVRQMMPRRIEAQHLIAEVQIHRPVFVEALQSDEDDEEPENS